MPVSTMVSSQRGWTVVTVTGSLDAHGAPRLREQLIDLIASGCNRLVVDFAGVDFIDSTGLGVLIGALKRVRSGGGHMRLVIDDERILRVVRITGLHRVFDVHDDVAGAATAVVGEPAAAGF